MSKYELFFMAMDNLSHLSVGPCEITRVKVQKCDFFFMAMDKALGAVLTKKKKRGCGQFAHRPQNTIFLCRS